MTEQPAEFDLPQFHRQIGVSGLAAGDKGVGAQFHIGVVRPFAGVLDATVIEGDQPRATPDLSYLTLEPLVSQTPEQSDQRSQKSTQSRHEARGSTSEGTDKEPTVREVLREQPRAESNDDTDLTMGTGSDLTTVEQAVHDVRQDRTQQLQTLPEMRQSNGDRSDSTVTHPPTVVVDHSPNEGTTPAENEGDGGFDSIYERASTGGEPTGGSAESWSVTERPTMTFLGRGIGTGGNAYLTTDGTTRNTDVIEPPLSGRDTDPDTGVNAVAEPKRPASQRPELTVEHTEHSGQASDVEPADRSTTADRATESPSRDRPGVTNDAPSEERAIIRKDGSVNDRVFDRIYRELQRRERRDRRREGR